MHDDNLLIADRLEGVSQPYQTNAFVGHDLVMQSYIDAASQGRLPSSWLLTGPIGVGKATFAFRMARALVACKGGTEDMTLLSVNEASDYESPYYKQVANGGHPNILHLRKPYDSKTKSFKTTVSVDEVRRTLNFFGSSAGTDGWRVVIVDSADEMNLNAANALLKILEEPPVRTQFFLLSSQPARLLPTIRSRCRPLAFQPLPLDDMVEAIEHLQLDASPHKESLANAESILGGSVRAALQYHRADGHKVHTDFANLMASAPEYAVQAMHSLATKVGAKGSDFQFNLFFQLAQDYLHQRVLTYVNNGGHVARGAMAAEISTAISDMKRDVDTYNLDRKQSVLEVFQMLKKSAV